MKKVILFYPNFANDGIKKNIILHYNFLKKKFDTKIITNSTKFNFNNKKAVINLKNKFFERNKFLNYLYCIFILFNFYRREKKLIIISFDESSLLVLINYCFFKKKITIRTSNPIYNPLNKEEFKFFKKKFFFQFFKLFFYRYASLIWTFSKKNKKYLKKNFHIKKVSVISNIFKKEQMKKIKLKNKYFDIFFVGRLIKIKDPLFIFDSLSQVLIKEKIRIFFVGEGNLKNKIKRLQQKTRSNIFFLGYKKNPFKVLKSKIDLFCLTSKFDGAPNALGEAISNGIPCIAPKGVGLSDNLLLNGKGGFLYKPGNKKNFCKKILFIKKNYNLAIKKRIIAYKNIDAYSHKKVLKKLIFIINSL